MSQNSSKGRLTRRVAYVAIVALVLLICGYYIPYWRPIYWSNRAALQKELEAAQFRGTPIRFSDLEVEDPNGFELGERVKSALEGLVELPSEMRHKLIDDEALTDSDKAKIREILAHNKPLFDQIEKAKPLDECRFRYDFQTPSPMSTPLREVIQIGTLGYLYYAQYQLAMDSEDYDQAILSIIDLLELTEALRKEILLVPQMVRSKLGHEAVDAIQKFLKTRDLTDEQFKKLDGLLQHIDSELTMKPTVFVEGATTFTCLENIGHPEIQKSLKFVTSLLDNASAYNTGPTERDLIHWSTLAYLPHLMDQKAWTLRTIERLSRVVDEPGPNATLEWKNLRAELKQKADNNRHSPLNIFMPMRDDIRGISFDLRHRLALARIAIRLRRYATQHGSFPISLTEIVDDALPKPPLNLWNDQPVTYQLTDTGCEISMQPEDDTRSLMISIALPLNKQ